MPRSGFLERPDELYWGDFPMKRIAIYPGSFDPVTNGHLDIIERASRLFDLLIVAISDNSQKRPYFPLPMRLTFLQNALRSSRQVRVDSFSGLLVNYVKKQKAVAVIRGL